MDCKNLAKNLTRNLTMMTDFYQLTMMQGYYLSETYNKTVVFDLFHRKNPTGNGYAIVAGLDQAIDYIKNLRFEQHDIDYLKSFDIFDNGFLEFLKGFRFTGSIYAVPEGSVVFPHEPLLRVHAPMIEGQLIETALLNIINHQSLIATKAARVVWAAQGDAVLEFGLRRAQGPDAGVYGARAAIIGGCSGTSNILAGQMFGVPVKGTHAHSWVMSFSDELTSFREYAKIYGGDCTLLVDTYDTLRSGVPNAIRVFKELKEKGVELRNYGVRLDSGDLAYLSIETRKLLDEAGFMDAVISASSDLDEFLIRDLKGQGARITAWGVGTNLITSKSSPAFGGVYKLAAELNGDGVFEPKIKLSDNIEKVTNPGIKKVFRIYDDSTNKVKADLIAMEHEEIDVSKRLKLFDPISTWKQMILKPGSYYVKELLMPVFLDGECVYTTPSVMEIKKYAAKQLDSLWSEHKRLINPQILPVDLSKELWNLKQNMINELLED